MSQEDDMREQMENLSERVQANADEFWRQARETQRKMDFIVEQQAQFAEDMRKLSEAQDRTEKLIASLAVASHNRFEELEAKMAALIDSHVRLADTQAQTDERLNAFINTVERLISERRNGGSGGAEV